MTAAVTPGGTSTYQYDPLGNRSATTVNGQTTRYLVDPAALANIVGQFDGAGSLIADYTYGLGLTSRIDQTGASAYYDFNAVGSTVGITGSAGTYLNVYSYLPFGGQQTARITISNPFGYVGKSGVTEESDGLLLMRGGSRKRLWAFLNRRPSRPDGG